MRYYTNNCSIEESIYDNKHFDGKVIVTIFKELESPKALHRFTKNKSNLDWNNSVIEFEFFNKRELKEFTEKDKEKAKEFTTSELNGSMFKRISFTLKQEIIDWLNDNIEDVKNSDENTPIEKRKGWAIGNKYYNFKQGYQIDIIFTRQLDAIEFIKKWSIYKKPISYIDSFNEDRREINIQEFINITNKTFKNKNIEEIKFNNISKIKQEINTDLSVESLKLIHL